MICVAEWSAGGQRADTCDQSRRTREGGANILLLRRRAGVRDEGQGVDLPQQKIYLIQISLLLILRVRACAGFEGDRFPGGRRTGLGAILYLYKDTFRFNYVSVVPQVSFAWLGD